MPNVAYDAAQDISVFHDLHAQSKGIVEISHIDKESSKWYGKRRRYGTLCKHYLTSLAEEYNNESMYFSLNTFKGFKRTQEQLFELSALYLDVDYYKTEYSKEQVLGKIDELVQDHEMPRPTFIVDSGRGLYLIWKIKRTPPQALPRWKELMDYFFEKLQDYGADPRCLEPSRIFRLNGSVHETTKKVVHTIRYSGVTYNMYNLRKEYLSTSPTKKDIPIVGKPKTKKKSKSYTFSYAGNKQILYLYNQYKVYEDRLQDLEKLAELRDYDLQPYHCRELMLFLTRYWTYCSTKDERLAIERTVALNLKFKQPLSNNEVINATKVGDKARQLQVYRYGNKKLIMLLSISPEEQYQLSSIMTEEIRSKKRAQEQKVQRRNENGLTDRQQKKLDNENKIQELVAEGYSTKEISDKIGLSVRQVQRIRKAMA